MMNVEPIPLQLLLQEEPFSDEVQIHLAAVKGLQTLQVNVLKACLVQLTRIKSILTISSIITNLPSFLYHIYIKRDLFITKLSSINYDTVYVSQNGLITTI
jgi:hypothetical protein